MSYIKIEEEKVKAIPSEMLSLGNKIVDYASQAKKICEELQGNSFASVNNAIIKECVNMESISEHVSDLGNTLEKILQLYVTAENQISNSPEILNQIDDSSEESGILSNILGKRKESESFWDYINRFIYPIYEYQVDSIVFDDNGSYGGNQGSAKKSDAERKAELLEVIRQNNSNINESNIDAYLKKLNSEGCGYVAMTNSIFVAFEGREKEFEEKFGYPMYDKSGDLNYDMLLADLYSSYDNVDPNTGELDVNHDYNPSKDGDLDNYNPYTDKTGKGSDNRTREYALNHFLNERGVDCKVTTHDDMSIREINKELKNGNSVEIGYHDGPIFDADGNAHYIDGGHSMIITGITDDGRYVVSSWGKEYYLDPNCTEYVDRYGDTVEVKHSMTYQVYDIKI